MNVVHTLATINYLQIGRVLAHTLQKDYYASQYIYTVRFCKAKFPQII